MESGKRTEKGTFKITELPPPAPEDEAAWRGSPGSKALQGRRAAALTLSATEAGTTEMVI